MKTGHTKGPWKIIPDKKLEGWLINSPDRQVCIAISDGNEKSTVFVTDEEAHANGKLIAAAPDLLGACRLSLTAATTPTDNHEADEKQLDSVIVELEAAINKATS